MIFVECPALIKPKRYGDRAYTKPPNNADNFETFRASNNKNNRKLNVDLSYNSNSTDKLMYNKVEKSSTLNEFVTVKNIRLQRKILPKKRHDI